MDLAFHTRTHTHTPSSIHNFCWIDTLLVELSWLSHVSDVIWCIKWMRWNYTFVRYVRNNIHTHPFSCYLYLCCFTFPFSRCLCICSFHLDCNCVFFSEIWILNRNFWLQINYCIISIEFIHTRALGAYKIFILRSLNTLHIRCSTENNAFLEQRISCQWGTVLLFIATIIKIKPIVHCFILNPWSYWRFSSN